MPDALQTTPTLLEVQSLQKVYESSTGIVEAIGDIGFTMRRGELVCIVGPSGCGKTTLLKCIAGLLKPTAGTVVLDGKKVTGPPPSMALVFQEYGRSLYPWLTVRGNVELPLKHKKLSRAERDRLVDDALTAVGLDHASKSYPWQLSGGMQQRVAIARAVAYQPEVLIMDEPFAAVDAQTRADLEDLVRTLHRERGMSILFVTHDIDESVYLGERVVVLSKSPTWVQEDLAIDLAPERDQITTRALPRFTELRTHVYEQIQRAKRGEAVRPGASAA
ncbi:ABC transporter ATP-binding protein [Microbacterium sp. BWT-B31]|uniref:ABC transporter ATP-binding protein n=1 Tax=Microbacterium sp. BWT-B31 TaxID=3232072 RepID=UPI00352994BA